jgi:hypothetical protein
MLDDSPSSARAFKLLAEAGIRADNVTAGSIGRVLDRQGEITALPHLSHAKAEQIGVQLADYWDRIIGEKFPSHDDFAWADIVQFVVRQAQSDHPS